MKEIIETCELVWNAVSGWVTIRGMVTIATATIVILFQGAIYDLAKDLIRRLRFRVPPSSSRLALGKDEIQAVRNFLALQGEHSRSVCSAGEGDPASSSVHVPDKYFDPSRDFVSPTIELRMGSMDRHYKISVRRRWWQRKKMRLRDVLKLVTTRTRTGLVYAIIGEPASGKTVEMVRLALDLGNPKSWQPGKPLPILIFANSLRDKSLEAVSESTGNSLPSAQSFVLGYLSQYPHGEKVPPAFIDVLTNHWRRLYPVILVDAVDEFPEKGRYEKMVDFLQACGAEVKGIGTVVLSCREGDYSTRSSFLPLRIMPLSHAQILQHFAKKPSIHPSLVKRGLEDQSATAHLAQYLTNVYFLTLYLQSLRTDRKPTSIRGLFESMFEWELDCLHHRRLDANASEYLQDALAPLAYRLTVQAFTGEGASGVFLHDERFLRLACSNGLFMKERLQGWRKTLSSYVETGDDASKVRLGAELIDSVDGAISELISRDPFPHGTAQPDICTQELLRWADGLRLPPPPCATKVLAGSIVRFLSEMSTADEMRFAAFQLAFTLRALGWAVAPRSGLLRWDPASGMILRFRHQRIREYLAAMYIDLNVREDFLDKMNLDNSWWRQTVNMLVATTRTPSQVLSQLSAEGGARG